jgi:ETC complex I subunit-like protein
MEPACAAPAPVTPAMFHHDAVAIIYKFARSAMTSGKARTKEWKLRFERRSPPAIEPLMGWTGGDDTLTQVELTFPSADAAVAYARRQDMGCVLDGSQASETNGRSIADSTGCNSPPYQPSAVKPRRLEWVERAPGSDVVCQGAQRGGNHSSVHHAKPQEVLRDRTTPSLLIEYGAPASPSFRLSRHISSSPTPQTS